jgi:two-component system, cell cycle response regulator DivK
MKSTFTVLLVQPRGDSLDLYCEYLRAYGLTCVPVSTLRGAMDVAPRADVIVTGILLPGSPDGVELIARLRADDRTRHIPIVVLTACAFESERRRAEAAGCDAFLAKPCLPSDLLAEIDRVSADARLRHVRGKPLKARKDGAAAERRKQGET